MAVINPVILQPDKGVIIVKWTLVNGDTGLPFAAPQHTDRSVQVYGTFGVGGSVQLEGSNEAPQTKENPSPVAPTWAVLRDPASSNLIFTTAALKAVLENTSQLRPNATAGDGTTSLKIIVTFRSARA